MNGKDKEVLGATIGGAAGGFIGAVVGGPIGALLGAAAVSWVGHQISGSR
jgi:hypothetical protein